MAVSLKKIAGVKSIEEKQEEREFILDWEASKRPRVEDHTGYWYYEDLTIAEAVQYHFGDELTTEHIPTLRRILKLDTCLTNEERTFIEGLIARIEEDAKQAPTTGVPTTEPQPDGTGYRGWLAECWREWNSLEWVEIDAYNSERLPLGARVRAYMEGKDTREALEFLRVVAETTGDMELTEILNKEEAKLNQQPNSAPTETPALRSELDKARTTIQVQQVRISELEALQACTPAPDVQIPNIEKVQALETRIAELENENEYLRDNQKKSKKGQPQQRGLLKLKACQRIGAFAVLLEMITGKSVPILRADGAQNKELKALYSEVTITDEATATADINKIQEQDHRITEVTDKKIRTELTRLLQALGIDELH